MAVLKKFQAMAIVAVAVLFFAATCARADYSPKVLVLHSYHQGFDWTDSIQKSVSETLAAEVPNAEVYVEYMNSKRQPTEIMSLHLRDLYRRVYRNVHFDVIIASDNNALDFLLHYRDRLFRGVPVVFCGVNNVSEYSFAPDSGYTGVKEDIDIVSTIGVALRLHPETRTLAVVADDTETSVINVNTALTAASQFPKLRVELLNGLSAEELGLRLQHLDAETVVLDIGFFRDSEGRTFSPRESMAFIQSRSTRPIYTVWDFAMAPGAIGGKLMGGRLQGEKAAELAVRILRGEKASDLPILDSPSAYTFDHNGLQRFGIDESMLPEGSVVTGKPDTIYTRYKHFIWFGTLLVVAQMAIIALLLWNIVRRQREESARKTAVRALSDTNRMFSLLLRHSPVYLYIKEVGATGSRVVMASDNFREMIDVKGEDMVGKTMSELFPPEFAEIVNAADALVVTRGEAQKAEILLNGRSYSSIRFPLAQSDKTLVAGYYIDITERKVHERQLKRNAHYDSLTGLPNRTLLGDRMHQAMTLSRRGEQPMAVAYLDLDGFKAVNDTYGHETGDQLLVALAGRMRQTLREVDTLARLGGDEFVAVLFGLADIAESDPILRRLLAAASQPVTVGELVLQVSASLGLTFYPQNEEVDADQLLRQADQAMYQAKLAGRNRYHLFDAEQDRSVRGRNESVERIRLALRNKEFVLYYQPKVNMRNGKVVGAEALIRWQHPEKGLLSPGAFLPVIEDHPLAVDVGEWVIDTALRQSEIWRERGLTIPVSVNLGARQLQQADFLDRLRGILSAHPHIGRDRLELEVLETSALEDIVRASAVIESCRVLGVSFSLDDFGTGYSSLTYLKRLSVSQIKIDQSFVRDMLDNPDDLVILRGILGLATAFKRQVIAEGVETVEQGTMLLQLGCELAQGYGIARPMPGDDLPGWAGAWRPDAAWSDPAASESSHQYSLPSL